MSYLLYTVVLTDVMRQFQNPVLESGKWCNYCKHSGGMAKPSMCPTFPFALEGVICSMGMRCLHWATSGDKSDLQLFPTLGTSEAHSSF